jgi:hypothetical protein
MTSPFINFQNKEKDAFCRNRMSSAKGVLAFQKYFVDESTLYINAIERVGQAAKCYEI